MKLVENDGICYNAGIVASETTSREELSAGPHFPVDGADWFELLIRKMMSASNVEGKGVCVTSTRGIGELHMCMCNCGRFPELAGVL